VPPEPPDWYGEAIFLIAALIFVVLSMGGIIVSL